MSNSLPQSAGPSQESAGRPKLIRRGHGDPVPRSSESLTWTTRPGYIHRIEHPGERIRTKSTELSHVACHTNLRCSNDRLQRLHDVGVSPRLCRGAYRRHGMYRVMTNTARLSE